jgi:hypothetical protein
MPDEIKAGDLSQEPTPATEPANTLTIEERAELEELRRVKELSQKDLKGKDSKITELTKQVMATKTAEEQAKIESDNRLKDGLVKYTKLAVEKVGLTSDFADLITGNDYDEIDGKIQIFTKIKDSMSKDFEKQIKTLTEELNILKANGTVPTKGVEVKGNIINRADFDKMDNERRSSFFKTGGKIQD